MCTSNPDAHKKEQTVTQPSSICSQSLIVALDYRQFKVFIRCIRLTNKQSPCDTPDAVIIFRTYSACKSDHSWRDNGSTQIRLSTALIADISLFRWALTIDACRLLKN